MTASSMAGTTYDFAPGNDTKKINITIIITVIYGVFGRNPSLC